MSNQYLVRSKTAGTSALFAGEIRTIPATILSSVVDASNTPTTTLSAGLPFAVSTASGKWVLHNNSASDGSQVFKGLLFEDVNMLDDDGTARDTAAAIVVTAEVNEDLVTEIATTNGGAPNWDKTSAKTDNLGLIWRTPANQYFPSARAIT